MPSVDDRIVRMQFDNAAFESKMKSTIGLLGQLEKALKFEGAGKGLSDISAAASKLDLSNTAKGIEDVSKKFIALSTIAITALSQITSKALEIGTQLIKSLTLDNVIAGFKEYEMNIGSIQTIMANTRSDGTNLQQVNKALDELNAYSDKTIYNFGQMTHNIGTFTAAGVDLNTSVQSIKGISNLAAISGSSADQASMAMYQLSQALASGTVKLMDWNSVVNAGMGGEVFQKSLFETGKALKTLKNVPMGQTFEQWKAAGNSFRDSLQDGWITADVLTTTLQGFTGEMTVAQLQAKGFSKEAAQQIIEMGNAGVDAATKVRTFTQMMSTLKESIGSGWSAIFRRLIGDFNDATSLFTMISTALGKVVQRGAAERMKVVDQFVHLGGRTKLIMSMVVAFQSLGKIINTIKAAFHDVFPPLTGKQLLDMSQALLDFLVAIRPTAHTLDLLKRTFRGFFAVLSIGWTIIKETIKFFLGFARAILGIGGTPFLELTARIGDFLYSIQQMLVKGKGIENFFKALGGIVTAPLPFIQAMGEAIADLFQGFDPDISGKLDNAGKSLEGFSHHFDGIRNAIDAIADRWRPLIEFGQKVVDILGNIFSTIGDFFSNLGQKIADNMNVGDFDQVLDIINVALLGGIAALIARFIKKGFKIDLTGGLVDKLQGIFDKLTSVLGAMQAKLKAEALMKIAMAIGILTASVLVLSMIDSVALTKALTAMSVGFGQLMASFALITKMSKDAGSAGKFTLIAAGMILLASAIAILAVAMKLMSTMDAGELAKGLAGLVVVLTTLSLTVRPMTKDVGSMMSVAAGLIVLSLAMIVFSKAVGAFGRLPMGDMIQGLIGISISLTMLSLALKAMPDKLEREGLGLLLIAASLYLMSNAVQRFSSVGLASMGKGFIGMAIGLNIIAKAMNSMPKNLKEIGVGMILLGVGLVAIAMALGKFAKMGIGELTQGLIAMALSLKILSVALNQTTGTGPGAAALLVMVAALFLLLEVVERFAKVSIGDLVHGLTSMIIVIGTFAATAMLLSEAIPFMEALGIAMITLGAGFALFGVAAYLAAKGIEALAKMGPKAAEGLTNTFKSIAKALPTIVATMVDGLKMFIIGFIQAAPEILTALGGLISQIIDMLIKLVPKLGELIIALINEVFRIVKAYIPQLISTGLLLLMSFLQGIRDNIGEITTMVGDIVINFLQAFRLKVPEVIKELVATFKAIWEGVAYGLGQIAATVLVGTGVMFIKGFIDGVKSYGGVFQFFSSLPGKILGFIGNVARTLWNKGVDILSGLFHGITSMLGTIQNWFGTLPSTIANWFSNPLDILAGVGHQIMQGLSDGITNGLGVLKDAWNAVMDHIPFGLGKRFKIKSPSRLMMWYGDMIVSGLSIGIDNALPKVHKAMRAFSDTVDEGFNADTNSMQAAFQQIVERLGDLQEFNPTITPVLDLTQVKSEASKIAGYIGSNKLIPTSSYAQASMIASTQTTGSTATPIAGAGSVIFEQTINAPKQLSTSDIYRQTRNQIALAKEELKIP